MIHESVDSVFSIITSTCSILLSYNSYMLKHRPPVIVYQSQLLFATKYELKTAFLPFVIVCMH